METRCRPDLLPTIPSLLSKDAHSPIPTHTSTTIQVPTAAAYEQRVRTLLARATPAQQQKVLEMYDVSTYTTPRDALIAFLSDAAFNCPTRFFARTLTHNQTEPVWRYFFTRRSQRRNGEVVKAAHGIELLYVFGTLVDIPLYQPDPIDLTLSQQIMRYWADLAITGDPDGGSSPRLWTAYDPAKDNTRQLDQNNQMLDGVLTQKCDLLDQIAGRETNHTSWAA